MATWEAIILHGIFGLPRELFHASEERVLHSANIPVGGACDNARHNIRTFSLEEYSGTACRFIIILDGYVIGIYN